MLLLHAYMIYNKHIMDFTNTGPSYHLVMMRNSKIIPFFNDTYNKTEVYGKYDNVTRDL